MRRKMLGVLFVLSMLLTIMLPIQAMAQDTIKLGFVDILSGNFKDIGDRYLEGVKFAVKEINASGGLLGKKVELIIVDSEGKPDVAARKATTLIQKEGVKFITGGASSAVGAALEQLAEKMNIIAIGYGWAAANMTNEKCSKNFFRTCLNTDQQSYALASIMAKKGYKKIGILVQDYSFGKEASEAFKRKLSKLSPSTQVVEVIHPTGTKDYAPYISQILSSNPDAVFTSNWGNDLRIFLKQARPMGMKQKVYGYFMNDEMMVQSFGNEDHLLIGDVGAEIYTLTIPTQKNKEFVAKFHKEMGFYPTWLRGKAYMSTMFWAEAVKKAGSAEVPAVIKAWEGLTYDGPAGKMTMRACDHQILSTAWTFEMVQKNPFYKHAYIGPSTAVPVKDMETPCGGEEKACKMKN